MVLKVFQFVCRWFDREGLALFVGFWLGVFATLRLRPQPCYYQNWMEENKRALLSKKKGGGE
jgi:hypothetical protein